MKILNEYEKGFIEASIDTDGSIFLTTRKNKGESVGLNPVIIVSFSNNSTLFLDKIQLILGTTKKYKKKRNKFNDNINYALDIRHGDLRWLLPQLKLVIKEKRRLKAIEILSLLKNGRNRFTTNKDYREKKNQLIKEWRIL